MLLVIRCVFGRMAAAHISQIDLFILFIVVCHGAITVDIHFVYYFMNFYNLICFDLIR